MESVRTSCEDGETTVKMFGPLVFEETNCFNWNTETPCLLCDDSFYLNVLSLPIFLRHLFEVHHVVVEDVQNIPFLPEYIEFWKDQLKQKPIEQIVPSVKVDSTNQTYFLLSSLLKDDKKLRHQLKLKYTLQVQEFERTDDKYMKPCLFCKLKFEGTRPDFLNHLSTQHNLQLGNPQNLVYMEELIDIIESKLKDLKCIYCEKTFPDRHILKEHMRKKLHKRINPQNKGYDKFYMVNYLEVDKNWQDIEKENDRYALPRESELNSDEEYDDWNEEEDKITCLFCDHKETNITGLCSHMTETHNFNFEKLTETLDFYQKVKLVNYIRRQAHNSRCLFCDKLCENKRRLDSHLIEEEHFQLPEIKKFDQPEFYFPTYENDALLYFIDDLESNE